MQITNVLIPKEASNNGLEVIRMDKIDRFVLIAGKNGSGKSRLLSTIKGWFTAKLKTSNLEQIEKRIVDNTQQVKVYEDGISREQIRIAENSGSVTILAETKF